MGAAERERIRKRARLAWDVGPSESETEAQRAIMVAANARHVLPLRRDDDREGHYVFNIGENLTPRYKILRKMGEGLSCYLRAVTDKIRQLGWAAKHGDDEVGFGAQVPIWCCCF